MAKEKKESFFKRLFKRSSKKNKVENMDVIKEQEQVLDEVTEERMMDENIIE